MRDLKAMINAEGLELEALENFEPAHWYDVLLDGPRRAEQMAHLKQIIRDVGRAGIPTFGYYFSLAGVWGRTEGPFAAAVRAPSASPIRHRLRSQPGWSGIWFTTPSDSIRPALARRSGR